MDVIGLVVMAIFLLLMAVAIIVPQLERRNADE